MAKSKSVTTKLAPVSARGKKSMGMGNMGAKGTPPMKFAKGGSIDGVAKRGKTNCSYPKMK